MQTELQNLQLCFRIQVASRLDFMEGLEHLEKNKTVHAAKAFEFYKKVRK